MISSGVTYEKAFIVRYFATKRDSLPDILVEMADEDFDPASHFRCPITQLYVDPDVVLPNQRI